MRTRTPQSGFTLLEMVISMVIISIIAVAGAAAFSSGVRAFFATSEAIDDISQRRYALQRIVRELSTTRDNPALPETLEITTMLSSQVVFTKVDGTTVTIEVAPPLVTISYSTIPGSFPLLTDLQDISELRFSYFDADGVTPTTDPGYVAHVEIRTRAPGASALESLTRVGLRNSVVHHDV